MKSYLIFLLTIMFYFSAGAQSETFKDVPLIRKKLSEITTDTGVIILKCRLAEAFRATKPDTSLILATESLTKSKALNFKKGEIHALVALCVLYREKGDLPYALELGLNALNLAEEEKLHFEQIYAHVRIANVYLAVRDFPKAISHLRNSEALLKSTYDNFQWAATQYFLCMAFEQSNDLENAQKQLQMLEEQYLSDPLWKIVIKRMRATIEVKRKNLPLAITYYRESNVDAMADSAYREVATTCNAMAMVFKRLGQTDSAIVYALEALRLGQLLSYKNRILDASNLLASLYAEKDPKEAVKFYQIASAARDSLYGVQKVLQLQSSTMKEQERQAEVEAARLAYRNRVRQWTLLGGIAVFIAIASILYRNNRQKQKSNRVLATTLTNLKATQAQLIQSEKMASLGELTAGIAHEIQNPLNFVNNFSEVNNELIEELKSENTNLKSEERTVILEDVYQNNEKIKHHGKRAEAIVKNMMQHAGTGSAGKEVTDINSLVDEYLRLAFLGMRAKDTSFNAKLETHFDDRVGKINIVPQEIGRVLLNLINNAFYAVNEKEKLRATGYEPRVTVRTNKVGNRVEIRVEDNGNGIPGKIRDKIFQPFFTTKPTGQGTGLGLSLAYDILKAHGGKIKVETKDGEGSEFHILLPVH